MCHLVGTISFKMGTLGSLADTMEEVASSRRGKRGRAKGRPSSSRLTRVVAVDLMTQMAGRSTGSPMTSNTQHMITSPSVHQSIPVNLDGQPVGQPPEYGDALTMTTLATEGTPMSYSAIAKLQRMTNKTTVSSAAAPVPQASHSTPSTSGHSQWSPIPYPPYWMYQPMYPPVPQAMYGPYPMDKRPTQPKNNDDEPEVLESVEFSFRAPDNTSIGKMIIQCNEPYLCAVKKNRKM